jgi:hypothetical protein
MDGTPEPTPQSAVNNFLDRMDEIIGKHRPCPICGCLDWQASADPIAFLATAFKSAALDDTDTGGIQVAFLFCAQCRFLRMHLMPDAEREG